jgi:hypothetical protein
MDNEKLKEVLKENLLKDIELMDKLGLPQDLKETTLKELQNEIKERYGVEGVEAQIEEMSTSNEILETKLEEQVEVEMPEQPVMPELPTEPTIEQPTLPEEPQVQEAPTPAEPEQPVMPELPTEPMIEQPVVSETVPMSNVQVEQAIPVAPPVVSVESELPAFSQVAAPVDVAPAMPEAQVAAPIPQPEVAPTPEVISTIPQPGTGGNDLSLMANIAATSTTGTPNMIQQPTESTNLTM